MKYKYAFYVSGNASRVIKYFELHSLEKYRIEFIFYDGGSEIVINNLINIFGKDKIVVFPDNNVSQSNLNIGQLVSDNILNNLLKCNVDYLFCFGSRILKPSLVNIYRFKIINFHPSLLPSFKGLNSIDQALNSSVQILGNTAHFIDNGVDTGLIILQSVISRSAYINYDSVLDLQINMLEKIWRWLENDQVIVNESNILILNRNNKFIFYS